MSDENEVIIESFAIVRPKFNGAGFEIGEVLKRRAPTAEHLLGCGGIPGDYIVRYRETYTHCRPKRGPATRVERDLLYSRQDEDWCKVNGDV